MNIVAIIQARMGSTRLPGKVMKEVLGKPLLEFQIERVRKSKLITRVVVATTKKETEQPIIDLCKRLSVDYFRGSEMDVLARYFEAANQYKADVVVRLTSDDPLIDPTIIDKIITEFLSNPSKYDYVSNSIDKTYPLGLDTEVFSMNALKQAYQEAKSPAFREHVTPYIRLHPDKFNIGVVLHPVDLSSYRLTVDTKEDLELISRVLSELYEKKRECFTLEDIIVLLQQHPEWILLNSHIEQKKLEDEL
ncbi:cytidylyltransferase domain-containing protein [Bacillaceae bacterium C204]|uniref:cytidylyltransferase domain-containing protein n=1 Tax=Neobacillus sp. 204 TaxID=3383351 RepID=UPI00397D5A09